MTTMSNGPSELPTWKPKPLASEAVRPSAMLWMTKITPTGRTATIGLRKMSASRSTMSTTVAMPMIFSAVEYALLLSTEVAALPVSPLSRPDPCR